MCTGFGWDGVNFLHFWAAKQGTFLKDQCFSLLKRHSPHLLLVVHCGSEPGYLEAVLLRHELLGFALVRGLQERAGGLGGQQTSGGSIAVL